MTALTSANQRRAQSRRFLRPPCFSTPLPSSFLSSDDISHEKCLVPSSPMMNRQTYLRERKRKVDEYLAFHAPDEWSAVPDPSSSPELTTETEFTPVRRNLSSGFIHGCRRCGHPVVFPCDNCKVVSYCTPQHQTNDS